MALSAKMGIMSATCFYLLVYMGLKVRGIRPQVLGCSELPLPGPFGDVHCHCLALFLILPDGLLGSRSFFCFEKISTAWAAFGVLNVGCSYGLLTVVLGHGPLDLLVNCGTVLENTWSIGNMAQTWPSLLRMISGL